MPDRGDKVVLEMASRQSINLDIKALLERGKLDIYPHVEERGLLFINIRRDKMVLSAGAYIGLIPLTPTLSIDVKPKLPVGNLARVLDVAQGSLISIPGVDRLYLASEQANNSVLEFLCANLLDALRPIEANGLLKEYVRSSSVTSHPRGRINISETLSSCWSRGQIHRVSSQHFGQTSNISANRIIKSALQHVLARLRRAADRSRELTRLGNLAIYNFPKSIDPATGGDFARCKNIISNRSLPPVRAYYYRAIEIALMILSNGGVSLQDRGSDILLESFILNFEILFEDYLRRVLQNRRVRDIVVRDGNNEGKKPLFDDARQPPAQPDIVLYSPSDRKKLIAEVKYKDKPSREDINQAVTYAVSYRTDRAILVHQSRPDGPKGLRHIGTTNGISIDAYAFDLANADFQQEERLFADRLFGLMV